MDRVHVLRDMTAENRKRLDPTVRLNLWMAEHGFPIYQLYAPSGLYDVVPDSAPPVINSRFLDNDAVRIDPARVPQPLRPLLGFGKDALAEFSQAHKNTVPVPDEVVPLDLIAQSAADAESLTEK